MQRCVILFIMHPLDEDITQGKKREYWLCAVHLLLQETRRNVPAEDVRKQKTSAPI